jgi:hypothetical protein
MDKLYERDKPGLVARISSCVRTLRHFMSNYHGSDTVVVKRKQHDGSFIEKFLPKAMTDYF